jgi:ubiquinone/menaquinone biosynthesis C-methylase UbiE
MSAYEAKKAYQNDETAGEYDRKRFKHLRGKVGDYLDKRTLSKALGKIENNKSLRIIDFPCGTARISSYLIADGLKVAGADISWSMMHTGYSKVQDSNLFLGFTQCDASQICFQDNAFDCVVCIRFIGHIPKSSRQSMFLEFNRISRFMVIEVSIKSDIVTIRKKIEHRMRRRHSLPKRWDWEVFDLRTLEQEFKESNFRIHTLLPKLRFLSDSWYILLERDLNQG